MSRQRRASAVAIPEEVKVQASPEEVAVPRVGRPRLDPSLDEAPVMTFRATAAFESKVKEFAKERDEPIATVLRQACEIGLKALSVAPIVERRGKF